MSRTIETFGFKNFEKFVNSTFRPDLLINISIISAIMGYVASLFEGVLGFEPIVMLIMLILFGLELFTGIRASLSEGEAFSSDKFQRAWIKFGVYIVLMGCANLCAVYIQIKPILGWEFNYYEWMHYTFVNFVIIQFFISIIENAKRLGWDELFPLIGHLNNFLKLKKKDDE